MKHAVEQLKEFHEKFGVPILEKPTIPAWKRINLRHSLIREESEELLRGIESGDLPEIADGIADLIYVCLGTALEFGIPIEEVWEEVHRTNMAKINGGENGAGKIQKPKDWVPPDVVGILERAKQY